MKKLVICKKENETCLLDVIARKLINGHSAAASRSHGVENRLHRVAEERVNNFGVRMRREVG